MARPAEVTIATLPVRLLCRELRAAGVSTAPMLAACGVSEQEVEDPGHQLSWDLCQALVDGLARRDPRVDLGLRAGARAELGDLDLPGAYLRMHEHHRDAAAFHRRYRDLIVPSRWMDVYNTDQAVVVAMPLLPGLVFSPVLSDCLLAACLQLARLIMGPIEPMAVHVRSTDPARSVAYRAVFGESVRLGSHLDALLLPMPGPDEPLPFGDATVAAALKPHVERRLADLRAARSEFVGRAAATIEAALRGGSAVSMEGTARQLGVSARTLRRALRARGTNYLALLDRVRGDLARQCALELPFLSGPEIAERVGYADTHVLYRAFRRWTGQSLSEFRQQRFVALGCSTSQRHP